MTEATLAQADAGDGLYADRSNSRAWPVALREGIRALQLRYTIAGPISELDTDIRRDWTAATTQTGQRIGGALFRQAIAVIGAIELRQADERIRTGSRAGRECGVRTLLLRQAIAQPRSDFDTDIRRDWTAATALSGQRIEVAPLFGAGAIGIARLAIGAR